MVCSDDKPLVALRTYGLSPIWASSTCRQLAVIYLSDRCAHEGRWSVRMGVGMLGVDRTL